MSLFLTSSNSNDACQYNSNADDYIPYLFHIGFLLCLLLKTFAPSTVFAYVAAALKNQRHAAVRAYGF